MTSTQDRSPRGRTRTVLGIVAAVVIVAILLLALALTGVASSLFARQVDRVVRNDVDASGLVASLATYQDSFRGGTLAAGRVDLGVQIDQTAIKGGDPASQPATIVLRSYSCPGANSPASPARLTITDADPAHLRIRPASEGGGVALTGAFEITAVQPIAPGVPECRIDLAAR